jgi:hypothetical protein
MTMFELKIKTGNAAFGETAEDRAAELARILRAVADRLAAEAPEWGTGKVSDHNGNSVGDWSLADLGE